MSESVCVARTSSMLLDGTLASSSCVARPVQCVMVPNAIVPATSHVHVRVNLPTTAPYGRRTVITVPSLLPSTS